MLGSERARQLAQRLLVPLVRDLGEIARQLQAHPLALADRAAALIVEAFEKIADRDAQHPGDFEQPSGRNPIDAALVFMRLLIGDADKVGELLLRQAEHDPAFADARADVPIDILCSARCSLHFRRTHGFRPQRRMRKTIGPPDGARPAIKPTSTHIHLRAWGVVEVGPWWKPMTAAQSPEQKTR
jgi:hypothetical protein